MSRSAETEQRALALVEQLLDQPLDEESQSALLSRESEAVRSRVHALKAAMADSAALLPTELAGLTGQGDVIAPPEQVGAFRLVRRIGAGGMGGVWLAQRDDGLYDHTVAVKLIRPGLITLAGAAFRAERQILARLEHPNIARLIDGGVTAEATPYLIMEYVDGLPIDEAVQGRSLADRIKLFVKAADAVQFAHSRLVVHADLKPSNIFVDRNDRVKLLDFGIARLIGEGDSSGGPLPMTAAYASPQRRAGAAPTTADDVYALGIILADLTRADENQDVAAIAAMASHMDEASRYGSVAGLITDLDRWRDQLPVAARDPSLAYRARLFVRRHLSGVLLTGAALLALSAISAIAILNASRAEQNRARAEQRFDEVRKLSKFQLYDLNDALARQPGTVEKRAQIARSSADYLARLNLSAETSPDLRLDAARSYRRLAAIQGLSGTSNLGRPEEALRSLAAADALLRDEGGKAGTPRADFLAERGWVHLDRWLLQPDNAASHRENEIARGYFARAQALAPDRADAALGLLVTRKNAAYDAIWSMDDPRQAIAIVTAALAQLDRRSWPPDLAESAAKLRIELLTNLGEALYHRDDLPGALRAYEQADTLIDALIAQRGAMPNLIIMKGQNAFDLSGTLGDMPGRQQEALAIARDGEGLLRRMLAQGPDAAAEKKLLILYGQEALLLSALGKPQDAVIPSAASIALRERRLAGSPDDAQRMRDLAIGLGSHADRLAEAGLTAEACTAADRTVALWAQISSRNRLSALDARKTVPRAAERQKSFCTG
jgi:serine/threonine-protein kinase